MSEADGGGYARVVRALYERQRLGIKMGLGNVQRLLAALSDPQRELDPILVGGTNGKGTVSHLLNRLLVHSGEPSGLYLSPHVERFTERISGPAGPIPEPDVAEHGDRVLDACARLDREGVKVTFFEATTALALGWFAAERLTRPVLEVGLGGRLDATNAAGPRLGGVTNVGSDHAEILGATVGARALEKFSVVAPGGLLLTTAEDPEALAVARTVTREGSVALRELPALHGAAGVRPAGGAGRWRLSIPLGSGLHSYGCASPLPPHSANHQLAAALWESATGRPLGRAEEDILARAPPLPGRRELLLAAGVRVLLDGAHNREALAALARDLPALPCSGPRVLVAGLMREKEPDAFAPLARWADQSLATRARSHRALPPATLAVHLARLAGRPVPSYGRIEETLAAATTAAGPDGLVVVAGSLFLVGEARSLITAGRVLEEAPEEVRLQ